MMLRYLACFWIVWFGGLLLGCSICMTTTPTAAAAGVPRQRLDFVYDSQGRRVSKTVSTSADGTIWTFASNHRFLYDGWNLIAEYED